jgi:hypothetical protein
LEGGDAELAATRLREALALWRGPALADFRYDDFAQREIARLEEARLATLEARIDADLALGREHELAPELQALVAEHPLRERLRGQLMLALYRTGRQVEALELYREGRRLLIEEQGLEPSRELQELGAAGRRFLREFGATQSGRVDVASVYAAQATELLLDAIARSDGTRASVSAQLFRARVRDGLVGSFASRTALRLASALELRQPLLEEAALGVRVNELERAVVGGAGVLDAVEPA